MDRQERDAYLLADDDSLMRQCKFTMQRGSGHGGQKINKTSSSVRLTHLPTGISAAAGEQRSQAQNRHIALQKIRFGIATRIHCGIPQDCTSELIQLPSENNHIRFCIWAAHLFDFAATQNFSIKPTADILQISVSKLDRILRKYPSLLKCWMEAAPEKEQICTPESKSGEE